MFYRVNTIVCMRVSLFMHHPVLMQHSIPIYIQLTELTITDSYKAGFVLNLQNN